MTRLTALTIQNPDNDIRCVAVQHSKNEWVGAIQLFKDGSFHRTLLSSKPEYRSEQEALGGMEGSLVRIRSIDLSTKQSKQGVTA